LQKETTKKTIAIITFLLLMASLAGFAQAKTQTEEDKERLSAEPFTQK